jgi:hypothetical protein
VSPFGGAAAHVPSLLGIGVPVRLPATARRPAAADGPRARRRRRMTRSLAALCALASLAPGAGSAAVAARMGTVHRQVYTVPEVRAQLARQGRMLVGRTIWVRGVVTYCGPLNGPPTYCLAPDARGPAMASAVDPLPLAWMGAAPPAAMHPDRAGVYRVRILEQARRYCGARVCYEALLRAEA